MMFCADGCGGAEDVLLGTMIVLMTAIMGLLKVLAKRTSDRKQRYVWCRCTWWLYVLSLPERPLYRHYLAECLAVIEGLVRKIL